MPDAFPDLYEYAMAHPCSTCKAEPGQPCSAPQKAAKAEKWNRLLEQVGREAEPVDPITLLHSSRQDAGARHRRRDIGKAPWPEERVPGQRYDTLDKPVRRSPRTDHSHSRIPRDPADDGHRDPELEHEHEIVWLEDPEQFDYVRTHFDSAPTRQLRPRWDFNGELVGYATLTQEASSRQSGYFWRRMFYVRPDDRPEHPDHAGQPSKAIDPRTLRPGIRGTRPGS